MNLTELLESAARSWPEKPALIEGSQVVSYSALAELAAGYSRSLAGFSLAPGARVGLAFPNSIAYVALTFALWRLNAIVVPIPAECTPVEAEDIARSLQLAAIVSKKPQSGSVAVAPHIFLRKIQWPEPADNHGLNLAFIRFTSGTTHARKGVALSHDTILARINAANRALGIGPGDTVIWCLPMSHHFLVTLVLYVQRGATVVLTGLVLARSFLETVNQWRGTVLYASPFQYDLLARDRSELMLPSVRLAVSTACPLTEGVAAEFQRRFQRPLSQALGVIELGLVSLNSLDPAGRWNSVGQPLPDFQVRVIAPDENGAGEIEVAGPGMFDAYAAPWLPLQSAAPGGWFRTGDIGKFDAAGFLYLLSRKNAVINLAGRKVFPEEIESVLNRHPAVRESRVYGRAHPHLGEIVEADVVLAEGAADLESVREFCRGRLAAFKIPVRWHAVPALPRTAVTGKIRREAIVA